MPGLSADEIAFWKRMAEADYDYHARQFDREYRSTAHLSGFLESLPGLSGGEAIDVGCGAGANIYHLASRLPGYRWTGLDVAGSVCFPIGRPRLAAAHVEAVLLEGDFFRLTEVLGGRRFDLVLFIQSIFVIPRYEEAVEQLLAVTKRWLVVTGLFTDFKVDARIEAWDYTWPADCQGPFYYNVYSLERFLAFCRKRGARDFLSRDFQIDIDLPRPPTGGLQTYTQTLDDGQRLQFTGPIHLPWKFVAVKMDR